MRVAFQIFRSWTKSWETLFREAAEFAASVGRDSLINISHSENHGIGVVTVWYWSRTS